MKLKKNKTLYLVELALLIAVEILFAVTPMGYLRIGIVEITFMPIPVALGAVLLGPWAGLLLGTVFGVTSFLQCFGVSVFGTAIFAIDGVRAFLLCVVTRMLMGLGAGWLPRLFAREKRTGIPALTLCSLSAPLLNTLLFVAGFFALYHSTPLQFGDVVISSMGLLDVFVFLAGINGVVEILVCTLLSTAICKVLLHLRRE